MGQWLWKYFEYSRTEQISRYFVDNGELDFSLLGKKTVKSRTNALVLCWN